MRKSGAMKYLGSAAGGSILKILLIAGVLACSVDVSMAELIQHEVTAATAKALQRLGNNFITGCVVLALGFVVAAFVIRRKT